MTDSRGATRVGLSAGQIGMARGCRAAR